MNRNMHRSGTDVPPAIPKEGDKKYIHIISNLLIVLWVYAAVSKLIDYEHSRSQMLNQVFSARTANILVWAVPAAELITASLLLHAKTCFAGLWSSLLLLLSFTAYIGLIMNNVFGRIPCSCGGILDKMSWEQHLVFNMVFLLMTSTAIVLLVHLKEGGEMGE